MDMKTNKQDIFYIIVILIIAISLFTTSKYFFQSAKGGTALIKYDNQVIMRIDLNQDQTITLKKSEYPLLLADMVIKVEAGAIAVVEELSPYHYCSTVGFVSSPLQPIVCLPNRVVIVVERQLTDDVDLEVR